MAWWWRHCRGAAASALASRCSIQWADVTKVVTMYVLLEIRTVAAQVEVLKSTLTRVPRFQMEEWNAMVQYYGQQVGLQLNYSDSII